MPAKQGLKIRETSKKRKVIECVMTYETNVVEVAQMQAILSSQKFTMFNIALYEILVQHKISNTLILMTVKAIRLTCNLLILIARANY